MNNIQGKVHVKVPVEEAFSLWTSFDRFPEFMDYVQEVRKKGALLHWRAKFGGFTREWDARIIRLVQNKLIAWKSDAMGAQHSGMVKFSRGPAGTNIMVQIRVGFGAKWKNFASKINHFLGVGIDRNLKNFKKTAESESNGLRSSGV